MFKKTVAPPVPKKVVAPPPKKVVAPPPKPAPKVVAAPPKPVPIKVTTPPVKAAPRTVQQIQESIDRNLKALRALNTGGMPAIERLGKIIEDDENELLRRYHLSAPELRKMVGPINYADVRHKQPSLSELPQFKEQIEGNKQLMRSKRKEAEAREVAYKQLETAISANTKKLSDKQLQDMIETNKESLAHPRGISVPRYENEANIYRFENILLERKGIDVKSFREKEALQKKAEEQALKIRAQQYEKEKAAENLQKDYKRLIQYGNRPDRPPYATPATGQWHYYNAQTNTYIPTVAPPSVTLGVSPEAIDKFFSGKASIQPETTPVQVTTRASAPPSTQAQQRISAIDALIPSLEQQRDQAMMSGNNALVQSLQQQRHDAYQERAKLRQVGLAEERENPTGWSPFPPVSYTQHIPINESPKESQVRNIQNTAIEEAFTGQGERAQQIQQHAIKAAISTPGQKLSSFVPIDEANKLIQEEARRAEEEKIRQEILKKPHHHKGQESTSQQHKGQEAASQQLPNIRIVNNPAHNMYQLAQSQALSPYMYQLAQSQALSPYALGELMNQPLSPLLMQAPRQRRDITGNILSHFAPNQYGFGNLEDEGEYE